MTLFEYSKSDSAVHKIPAVVKLIIMIATAISACFFNAKINLCIFAFCLCLSFVSKIKITNFLRDMLPILWYSLFILLVNVASSLLNEHTVSVNLVFTHDSLTLIVRLITVVALTSIFLRTTSLFDLFFSLKKALPIVLFFNFFSRLFSIWNSLSKSYYARGGKNGIKKIVKLLPLLIALGIKKANDTYLSICNRSKTRL